jgi:hypothetical protein
MRKLRIVILALTAGAIFTLSASPAAVAGQLRSEWQDKKKALVTTQVTFTGMNEEDFGPRLDTFEAAKKAYDNNKDAGKKQKLKTDLDKAIADAKDSGTKYHNAVAKAFDAAAPGSPQKKALSDAEVWLITALTAKLKP